MKKLIILLILTCFAYVSESQIFSSAKENELEKLYVGGMLGLQFGTLTNIDLSSYVGYYIMHPFSVGLGASYQYHKNSLSGFELNIYGGRAFSRVDLFDFAFLHAEFEVLTYKTDMHSPIRQVENIINDNLLVGVGYKQLTYPGESISGMYIMLLFNLNETIYTPYGSPLLRIGLEFGIGKGKKLKVGSEK